MEDVGSVQQKVSCVFETVVLDGPSNKRENQSYKVGFSLGTTVFFSFCKKYNVFKLIIVFA